MAESAEVSASLQHFDGGFCSVYLPPRHSSICSRLGIAFAVPILVVESPAVALAKAMASRTLMFSASPTARPALNASPAPVVSTTGVFKVATGQKNASCVLAKNEPLSPETTVAAILTDLRGKMLRLSWKKRQDIPEHKHKISIPNLKDSEYKTWQVLCFNLPTRQKLILDDYKYTCSTPILIYDQFLTNIWLQILVVKVDRSGCTR